MLPKEKITIIIIIIIIITVLLLFYYELVLAYSTAHVSVMK
jgi:hypothetical protein